MKVSAALSIHNRSKLFRRALDGYLWQTMSKDDWEIVLVDDMSTEDLSEVYKPFLGRINLKHIRMDHTKHPVFEKMNPGWIPGQPKNWYHTPAISTNIALSFAKGQVVCLCHPEVLHAPKNFEFAYQRLAIAKDRRYLFGETWLGSRTTNACLDRMTTSWTFQGWDYFMKVISPNLEGKFDRTQLYWYVSFLPLEAALKVRGVDFDFLGGVCGEDDDFKYRVQKAGYSSSYDERLKGIHQNHANETEPHRVRNEHWKLAQKRNTSLLLQKLKSRDYIANLGVDWTGKDCIVDIREYVIGGPAKV